MGLLDRAKADYRKHVTSNTGAGVTITVTNPEGTITVEVVSVAMSRHLSVDLEGSPEGSKNTHICMIEATLNEQGYVTRDSNAIVDMFNHKVSFADSTGVVKHHIIGQTFPDETLGLILCLLKDYE